MKELKGTWVQGGAVKLESSASGSCSWHPLQQNERRRGNWSCLVSIWKGGGMTTLFLPLLGCMREDPAPSASIAFALNALWDNVIKSLQQWWQYLWHGVNSDTLQCFGWPSSIHQHPTALIPKSTPHSCTIWGGCMRMGCVLSCNLQTSPPQKSREMDVFSHNLWSTQELCENRTCFGPVLGGSRGHGRTFYKDASRTKALKDPELSRVGPRSLSIEGEQHLNTWLDCTFYKID